jgi:hypothetical protein
MNSVSSSSSETAGMMNNQMLFQNPMFLHPSDGPGTLMVTEKLLGAQNYRSWRRSVEIALSTKRKLGFIRGTVPRSVDDASLQEQWDTCNNLVISWLMNSVSESMGKSIMFMGTAHAIWLQLETRFALSNGSHKYKLNRETYAIMQSGRSISEYYTNMKCVWEELDSMNELPRIVNITPEVAVFIQALNVQKEEQRLFQFLNGLDDHFTSQRSQLLLNSPLPSVETACSLLQQEESQRGVFGNNSHVGIESTALYSKGEVKDKCNICVFKWHPPEKCWEKIGYPVWHYKYKQGQKGRSVVKNGNGNVKRTAAVVENSGHVVFTSKQFEQLMKSLPQFNQNAQEPTKMDHPFGEGTIYCFSCTNGVIEGWIIDTGASDHISPESEDLIDVQTLKYKQMINLPNGHTSIISQVGNKVLQNKIELKNVLVVPSFKFRLLSVSKLTKDSQCFVTFYEQFCVIQDLKTRKVLGLGKKKADLYHLLNLPLEQVHAQLSSMVVSALEDCSLYSFFANCSVPDTFAFSVFNNSYSLWHHRLGHVSNSTLKHIDSVPQCHSNASNKACLTCPMAKFAKLPYPTSVSHSKVPFHLIHIDIWGPYKVPTIGHHRYFLTIVDDCSRAVWTYLLVKKSDAFTVLKSFHTFVKTQFEKDIKIIRSDNALEFLKGSIGPYMKSLGIEHQTSCVNRPQQNGRVERKHRNILEISRALRLHAHLPVHYWGDCVITATYLINRFPTAVLKFKTPYEILMHSKPDYGHLRVFWCLAVASNPTRVADKFESRGVPCLFLGYPQHQKGYKLYNLLTHTRFVSRDVVFYEHIFSLFKV